MNPQKSGVFDDTGIHRAPAFAGHISFFDNGAWGAHGSQHLMRQHCAFVSPMQDISQQNAKFLERLDFALKKAGVSRGEIARRLGIAKSTVSRWSNGSEPRVEYVTQIAEITGVRREWLATGLEPMLPYMQNEEAPRMNSETPEYRALLEDSEDAGSVIASEASTLKALQEGRHREVLLAMLRRMSLKQLSDTIHKHSTSPASSDLISLLVEELSRRAVLLNLEPPAK